jgi:AbrB family looped-hinge helix DNA binding protein
MAEILMTVTSKGQVTIPAAARKHLHIERNQKIALVLESDGTVRLKVPPYTSIASLRGAAGSLGRNLSWQQMRAIAREDNTQKKPARKRASRS